MAFDRYPFAMSLDAAPPVVPDLAPAGPGARVRFPPPLVFLAGLVGGVLAHRLVAPLGLPVVTGWRVPPGIAVALAGLALIAAARIRFARTHQSPTPWTPTASLIFDGPYRRTRNPMYLGAFLIMTGLGVALGNMWIAALAWPALTIVHLIAVRPEERYLAERFGEPYRAYLASVPRYL